MKSETKLAGGLLLGMAVSAACYMAVANPTKSPDDTDKLNQGVVLFKQGRIAEARAVLTNLPASSPVRGQAKAYIALSRYAEGDHKKFLSSAKSPEVESANLPEEVREDLDYKQMDSLMFFRKFDEVLPRAEAFAQRHANSPRVEAVAEYQLASLYERGMKKLAEAAQLKSRGAGTNAQNRLLEGEANLEQFLKLAADARQNNYQALANRDLAAEVVQAMTALGGETEAVKLVAPAEREMMTLALVRLHKKIDADADANLRRMTNFLKEFPNSKYRSRVQLDMGNVALDEGWRLTWQYTWQNDRSRSNAAPYLAKALELLHRVVEDKQAGVSEADVQEAQANLLLIYRAQNDWEKLSDHTAMMLTNTATGSRDWLAAKLYKASGLAHQKKLAEAASEFDELLATGFKGVPTYDGLLVPAAQWRIRVARQMGDEAAVLRVVKLVQDSKCYDSRKRAFFADYTNLLAHPLPAQKKLTK